LRDSAGLSPDFAELPAITADGAATYGTYKPRRHAVKADQMSSYWLWQTVRVHLLPAERHGQRVIDGERVCQAIEAIGDATALRARAAQFALLSDPTRLTVLTCINAAGPISVSDLAAATGITDTTVSQTLRHLRASGTVAAERDGRVVRYRLIDSAITALLSHSPGQPQLAWRSR
jgi:ArsR family transcriptional regulator, lead/cadmium/zinc/bismuth-responsive transcriptional repressor